MMQLTAQNTVRLVARGQRSEVLTVTNGHFVFNNLSEYQERKGE